MMNVARRMLNYTAIMAFLAASSPAWAQDGLAGELDALLGLGGEAAPAAPAATQPPDAQAAAQAPAVDPAAQVPAAAPVPAEPPAAAEAAAAVAAEIPAAVENAAAVAAEAPAVVEDAAAVAAEAAAEAAPAVAAEAPAVVEDAAAVAAEAPAAADVVAEVPVVGAAVDVAAEAPVAIPAVVAEPVADMPVAAPEAMPVAAEAAPAAAAPGDATAQEIGKVVSEIDKLEEMRRMALETHGRASLEAGHQALRAGNYPEAQKLYEEAAKFITRRPGNEDDLDAAENGAAEAIYRQAVVLRRKNDREAAIQLARQAREKGHAKAPRLVAELQEEIDNPPPPPPPKVAKRWNEDTYRKDREDSRRQLGRAREFYITGEYDHARGELELILKDDPYNQDALQMLRRVNDRIYDVSSGEFATTRSRMIGEVRDSWTPRRYAMDIVPVAEGVTADKIDAGVGVDDPRGRSAEEVTIAKMRNITIPEINFRAANINDVVGFFESASREYDSQEIPPEQRGVSFVLKLPNQDAAPAAPLDPFAPAGGAGAGGIPPITFSARFVTLYEALSIITDVAGLKFRVRGSVVMIMPLNMSEGGMTTRSYTVLPSIGDRASSVFREMGGGAAGGAGGMGGGFLGGGGAAGGGFLAPDTGAADTGQVDWKQLFADMGVQWPDGSSVSYIPSINKMRVYNTPENLADVEIALQELNVTPRQIEIEARFVEVSQTDLESLGFEWLLGDDWEIAHKKGNSQERIKINAGSGTKGMRYLTDAAQANPSLETVSDGILSAASVLTNPELNFVLHMLSQRANTDLLSAPKVVTKNSQEAIIKVVTEYIYPTEYDITENQTQSADNDNVQENIPMVEPGGFEMREVGVILQVLPEVSADGQMIDLTLNPQIISEPSWKDYGFDYYSSRSPDPVRVVMEQPFFQVRSIATSISIYNGATVVMGGMITEQRTEIDDKVPLLGDIPVVGRLFRSRYEQSEKRNLLIFVTARLVDPAGRFLSTKADSRIEDAAAPNVAN